MPLVASAQEGEAEQEGEAAAAPEEGAEATESADEEEEVAEEEAAPEPQPEPEVSAVESEVGNPALADEGNELDDPEVREEGWHPSHEVSEDESTAGEGDPAAEEGRDGLVYDMETGRWVEDTEPLPWRNSLFIWNNSVSLDTFVLGARRSYNPTYIQSFSLRPRWYVGASQSIRLRQDLNWELTHNDINNNSAWFGDLSAGIIDTGWFMMPGDIAVGGGVTAFFPVSIGSRNCGLITGLQGSVSATKVFAEVMTGLTFQAFGSFRGNFHSTSVCNVEGGDRYGTPAIPGPIFGDNGNTGGVSNSMMVGSVGAVAALAPIPELSFSVVWQNQWSLGRGLADACFDDPSAPGGMTCLPDLSDTHTRVFTFFSLSATWLASDWFNASLSYGSFNFSMDGSGNVYNPFYNPQSQFTLQGVFVLDRVYQGVEGMLEEDDVEEDPATATARNEDEEEDSDGEQVAALRNRRATQ